jgi:hypothetical protein
MLERYITDAGSPTIETQTPDQTRPHSFSYKSTEVQTLLPASAMAITEVIFPKLKPDQALLKQLATTLPTAAKTTFSGVPGLSGYYRGKIIEAQNVSQAAKLDHSGLVLVLGALCIFRSDTPHISSIKRSTG